MSPLNTEIFFTTPPVIPWPEPVGLHEVGNPEQTVEPRIEKPFRSIRDILCRDEYRGGIGIRNREVARQPVTARYRDRHGKSRCVSGRYIAGQGGALVDEHDAVHRIQGKREGDDGAEQNHSLRLNI